jgi:tetratricopeptide (TPR) repeat protein
MISSQISETVKEIIEHAKYLESIGRYHDAADSLSHYWSDITQFPDVKELNNEARAEVFLRCGSLVSNLISFKQTKNGQEFAQDLLKQALSIFLTLGLTAKIADCEAHLATTYCRLGSLDEAKAWINSALKYQINETDEIRLYSYVVEGLIFLAEKNHIDLISKCEQVESLFRTSTYYVLQGDFNNNYAVGLMRLGKNEEALKRFELAKSFYVQTEHFLYLALLENNLAGFYQLQGRYEDAHNSAISAKNNFKKVGDKTREGFSIDTRAHVYMAEGKYKEALSCSKAALKILQDGENYSYLANSTQTKSHIEFYLNDYAVSLNTMVASVTIASIHVSKALADKFIEEYAAMQKKFYKD